MNYNKLLLGGRLTRDPELRYTPNEKAVVDITVAVNDGYGDKKTAYFVDATVWGKAAENLCKFFAKGDPVFLEGKIVQETWEDKQTGKKRSKLKMVAFAFEFCGQTKGGGVVKKSASESDSADEIGDDETPF
jgi:single-strand DNA-binding protein